MTGANEYASLFETGQYGRLYVTSGKHARGSTFQIQVLPAGEEAEGNGEMNLCVNKNAVEVYGIISGNPGWTEAYGWLHEGKWVDDFTALVKEKRAVEKKAAKADAVSKQRESRREHHRERKLLKAY